MRTIVHHPFQPEDRQRIREILVEQRGIVVYPTETFYALGCIASAASAVRKIYALKGRRADAPLLVLIDDWPMLERYAVPIDTETRQLLARYWPGPLTAILPAQPKLATELNQTGPTLGFRMTSSVVARELIRIAGLPLVGTSANLTAGKEISRFEDARALFSDRIDLSIDGGDTPGGLPSTVIDLSVSGTIRVRRQGAIQLDPSFDLSPPAALPVNAISN